MDQPEQQEMDPRMAEMMGFTSFGMQPDAKKRKVSTDDDGGSHHIAVAYPTTMPQSQGLGHQNGLPSHTVSQQAQGVYQYQLAPAPSQAPPARPQIAVPASGPSTSGQAQAGASGTPTTETPKSAFPSGVPMEIFERLTWKELEAYRKGVKNEQGDLAWFLPSFIEDPWAKFEVQRGQNGGASATS